MAVYNRIFTEEKWERVNKYNKNLLNDYMMQIKSEGKSKGTMNQYFNDARIILIYILEELDNKPLYKLNRKSFRNMVLWMQENNLSPARVNRMLSVSRNLLNFGMDDDDYADEFDDCKANPSRIKGMQKERVRNIVFLSEKEMSIIFEELMKKGKYAQALLCALMYDSASRRNEVYQLKRDDISLEESICKSVVVGKRGKKYRPLYNQRTKDAYVKYMKTRTDQHETLWVTREGTPASYESLYAWVVSWRKLLVKHTGEYKEFNAHSWRHSALENYSNGTHYVSVELGRKIGMDVSGGVGKCFTLEELQILANHSDISTTQSYLMDKSEDMLLQAFGI